MEKTRPTRRIILAGGAALAIGAALTARAQDDRPCAVVLLHGKWGDTRYFSSFAHRLQPYCHYEPIELPWSKRRNYDAPYPSALQDIAVQVQAFRDQGYRRVVLVGHSLGANAALAYMAQVGDADAVVAVAPGHVPDAMYRRGIGRDAVDKARELVRAGQGDQKLVMDDLNQGKRQSIRMRADVLLSYFDPAGLAHMPATAAAFRKPVPLLWVVGTTDPIFRAGEEFAFRRVPFHPASQYLVYQGGHMGYQVTVDQVLAWIQALP